MILRNVPIFQNLFTNLKEMVANFKKCSQILKIIHGFEKFIRTKEITILRIVPGLQNLFVILNVPGFQKWFVNLEKCSKFQKLLTCFERKRKSKTYKKQKKPRRETKQKQNTKNRQTCRPVTRGHECAFGCYSPTHAGNRIHHKPEPFFQPRLRAMCLSRPAGLYVAPIDS